MFRMTPASEWTDGQLAALLADPAQQTHAFNLLYGQHATALLAFAASRFRNRAEDLCQNAWLEAFKHKWGPTDNVRAWLFRVVINRGISALRKERTVSLAGVDEPPAAAGDPYEPLLRNERIEKLKRCREKMRQRKPAWEAVIQAFLDGEAPAAAAERLRISRANFDQRKSRALDALARCAGSETRGHD
jgi:RNA polymerase sigma factor (sigma-70 family)